MNKPPSSPGPVSSRLSVSLLVGEQSWGGELWLPFESARHPETDAVAAESAVWLQRHGLLRPANARAFARARFAELAGRVYYRFDRAGLRLAADFIAALFVLDDLMDDASRELAGDERQLQRALESIRLAAHSGRPHPSPIPWVTEIGAALADLTRRLAERGCPLSAYLRELDIYLEGVRVEAASRVTAACSPYRSVAEYAAARVAFSAVYACIELGLSLRGRELPRRARELARLANLSVSWVNDVYSWPKERSLGERSNLVVVLGEAEGLGERDALERACRLCDEVAGEFVRQRGAVHEPEVVALLEAWMRGNGDWHQLATDRYRAHVSVVPRAA